MSARNDQKQQKTSLSDLKICCFFSVFLITKSNFRFLDKQAIYESFTFLDIALLAMQVMWLWVGKCTPVSPPNTLMETSNNN